MHAKADRNWAGSRNRLLSGHSRAFPESAVLPWLDPQRPVRHYKPQEPYRGRHYTARGAYAGSELRHRDFASGQTRFLRPVALLSPELVALIPEPLCEKWPMNSSSIRFR